MIVPIVVDHDQAPTAEQFALGIADIDAFDRLADDGFSVEILSHSLSEEDLIEKIKELEKRAHRTASEWAEDYSPYRFCQFVAELGIVGRLREKCSHFREESTGTEIFEADFEYALKGRLVLADEVCAIHPMFYKKLNIKFNRISSTLRKKLCLPEGVTPCIYPSIPRS